MRKSGLGDFGQNFEFLEWCPCKFIFCYIAWERSNEPTQATLLTLIIVLFITSSFACLLGFFML